MPDNETILTKGDVLLIEFRATDPDRFTDNAFYERILATYHALAEKTAECERLENKRNTDAEFIDAQLNDIISLRARLAQAEQIILDLKRRDTILERG